MRGEQFYRGLMRIMNDIFAGYEFLASVSDKRRDLTRFANSQIHQNVSNEDSHLAVILLKNNRMLVLNANDFSTDTLKRLREVADESMEILPELPYKFKMPPLRMAFPFEKADPSMKNVPPSRRAELFDVIKSKADEKGLQTFGYVANDFEEIVVMSTSGLFLYSTISAADYNVVFLNDSGSGSYASGVAPSFEKLDLEKKIDEVADLAKKNVPQAEIEPGEYTVILGPEAVATLFSYFAFAALNGFSYEIGTSSAVKYLGKKIGPEFLNFKDDPKDERLIGMEFDLIGNARDTFPIIENGEFKNILYAYGTALRFGKKPTGHTINLEDLDRTFTLNPVITGGNTPKEKLFEEMGDGIYIHRFHYVNVVDPSELIMTGMTRDGFFLVEKGKITKALRNMRFNVNFYQLLENLRVMSSEEEVTNAFVPTVAPYALFERFTFSSKTDH
jgi:PmbA protein